jgi:hypothetical protein
MKKIIVFLSVFVFTLFLTHISFADTTGNASSTVNIVNNVNSTNSTNSTSQTSGHTSIRIETNGNVKTYESDTPGSVHLQSDDGTSTVDIDNNTGSSNSNSENKTSVSNNINVKTDTSTNSARDKEKMEKQKNKDEDLKKETAQKENIFQRIVDFFKNLF